MIDSNRANRGISIIGSHNRSAIWTLVERTSQFRAFVCTRRSSIWDRGAERVVFDATNQAAGLSTSSCHRASPGRRATNENKNGLLSRIFKDTALRHHSPANLGHVPRELNNHLRKSPNGRTAALVFIELAPGLTQDRYDDQQKAPVPQGPEIQLTPQERFITILSSVGVRSPSPCASSDINGTLPARKLCTMLRTRGRLPATHAG